MTCQQFRDTNFQPATYERIRQVSEIINEYDQKLTARQVFYQLVSRDLIENTPRSYQNTTKLLTDARYAGLIDWEAIEDRGRTPQTPSEFTDVVDLVDVALKAYRLPRWADQDEYVELWVEKQALAGVLGPIASKWHVTLMVNKGYSSASAMRESAERIMVASCNIDRAATILYLGDHDPSGEDMVRDIEDRLVEFGCELLTVDKIALTMAQIRQFNPPPNPAKLTDSRAQGYIAKYGTSSWELDALPPRELNRLVEEAIREHVDVDKMIAIQAQEEEDRKRLRKAAAKLTK